MFKVEIFDGRFENLHIGGLCDWGVLNSNFMGEFSLSKLCLCIVLGNSRLRMLCFVKCKKKLFGLMGSNSTPSSRLGKEREGYGEMAAGNC